MKAPSPLCLQVLRSLAFPHQQISKRCYASSPKQPQPSTPTSPPALPRHTPGFRLRETPDDDSDHTPVPLSRPIGLPYPPEPGQNTGLDNRDLRTRRNDFVDYDKHLVKRAKMTKQISKPYFRDWSNLRFHKGKVFVAPERLFKAETALYFPNFFGRTLRRKVEKWDRKDGYGGLGRDTCEAMMGKVSVVTFMTSQWAQKQVGSWMSESLKNAASGQKGMVQTVTINYEDNTLKYWIWRLFGLRRLRRQYPGKEQQENYFLVRRGFSDEMKEAMGVLNEKAGYVYLVDADCRIRWAGSAIAEEHEKESLVRGLKKLLIDIRGERTMKQARLESVVNEIVDEEEEKPAASAGG